MKRRSTETGSMQHFARSACVMLLIMALLGPSNFLLTAQTTPTAQPTPPAQSPPAQTTPSGPSAENATISPDQLDSLVAPIALYPDNLLADARSIDVSFGARSAASMAAEKSRDR